MHVGDDTFNISSRRFRVSVASGDQAPAVMRLRDELAAWMVEREFDQWNPGEMPLSWLESCIAYGWVYTVWEEEFLVASVTVAWRGPFVWGNTDEAAGYIHILMVDRAHAGKGIGRSLLSWAESPIPRAGRRLARPASTLST